MRVNPGEDLLGGGQRGGAEDGVVGVGDDAGVAVAGAVAAKPGADGGPGDDGIEPAGELIDGKGGGAGKGTRVVGGDEAEAMEDGEAVGFGAAGEEFVEAGEGFGGGLAEAEP